MPTAHFTIATAGHVDHGKSALVKALTGTDPDRLPEEKSRGITIDLGFAHLPLPTAPNRPDLLLDVGIVDVPGHEDFVKNMIAGVGSVDLALLIVAANDGWMPQTEEHLQIVEYLQVPRLIVALTKSDLAEAGMMARRVAAIQEQLAGSAYAKAPIVPTSVVTGVGLDALRAVIAEALREGSPPTDSGKPRLNIDRAFSLAGRGTIVTGTLRGGTISRQQPVVLEPSGQTTRVRTVQSHGRELDRAEPGMRVALNLPELPLARAQTPGVARGQTVTVPELGPASRQVDVELRRSGRVTDPTLAAGRPLKYGTRVWIHHGTAAIPARVLLDGSKQLELGGRSFARLQPEQPWFVLGGDRFILRDWSGQATVAGGLVLETCSTARRNSISPERRRTFLERRSASPNDPATWVHSLIERDRFALVPGLLAGTRFSIAEIDQALLSLREAGSVLLTGPFAVLPGYWDHLREMAVRLVDECHRLHPDQAGLSLTEVRRILGAEAEPAPGELMDRLISELCLGEFQQSGTALQRRSHHAVLPPALQAVSTRLREALIRTPLEPPPRKELASSPAAQQVLRFLVEKGELVEVGPELVFSANGFAQARERICHHLKHHGQATASELRQALGTSRRVIIPLLERLDREGVTLRRGDLRVLR